MVVTGDGAVHAANACTLNRNKLVLVRGSQLLCSRRQKVWAGALLPKLSDTVRQ